MANYDVESHIKKLFFYFFLSPYARTTRYEEAFLPEGKKMASVASLPRLCLIKITTERQTTESDIPPSYRATKRYTKIHLGFCLRFSTLIGQIGRVQLSGAGPKRYIRSRLFRLAVTAFWRALTASWRQNGKRKQRSFLGPLPRQNCLRILGP